MHIHYIWILITLFMYKSNSIFLQVYIFTYIIFQWQWAIFMQAKKMWHGKFMDAIHMLQNVY